MMVMEMDNGEEPVKVPGVATEDSQYQEKRDPGPWTEARVLVEAMINRHRGIDVLRFFAVLYVLFHHIDYYLHPGLRSNVIWARADDLIVVAALSVFVYSSGLFLGSKHSDFPSLARRASFLRRRLSSLYTAYLVAVVLFILLEQGPALSGVGILQHVFLVQTIAFQRFGPELPTLWFVSMLAVFYVLYAFAPFRLSGTRSYVIAASVSAVVLLVHWRS